MFVTRFPCFVHVVECTVEEKREAIAVEKFNWCLNGCEEKREAIAVEKFEQVRDGREEKREAIAVEKFDWCRAWVRRKTRGDSG